MNSGFKTPFKKRLQTSLKRFLELNKNLSEKDFSCKLDNFKSKWEYKCSGQIQRALLKKSIQEIKSKQRA